MDKPRKPYLVVYDDYTVEMTEYGGKVQTFDLMTRLDWNPHIRPITEPSAFQEVRGATGIPRFEYVREGEIRFSIRERPTPPPGPPYNTVDLKKLRRETDPLVKRRRFPG